MPAAEAIPPVTPGDRAFARMVHGYQLTTLAALGPMQATVKHPNPAFQTQFFDRRVSATEVYVPARVALRERDARWGQLTAIDLFSMGIRAVQIGVFVGVGAVFVWVFGGVAIGMIRASGR